MPFHHPRTHGQQHALQARLVRLLRHRTQAFFQRQSGTHQGGQLASQQGELGGADAAAQQSNAGLPARVCPLDHFLDSQRDPALLAQLLAHLARGIALENTFLLAAAGIQRSCIRKHP